MKYLTGLFLSAFLIAPAMAQDGAYTPPPMFDAPAMNAQPHETRPAPVAGNTITGGRVSRVTPAQPAPMGAQAAKPAPAPAKAAAPAPLATPAVQTGKTITSPTTLLPSVIMEGDPALTKRAAARAPSAPKEAALAPKPPAKPQIAARAPDAPAQTRTPAPAPAAVAAAPAPSAPKVDAPAMPAARVTSKGVVTGPKTMPSVPTGTVVAENLMEQEAPQQAAISPQSGDEPTLMERHHEQQLAMAAEPAAAQPATAAPIALPGQALEPNAASPHGTLTIPYQPGLTQIKNPPLAVLIDALKADGSLRVMINAYGTPVDDGENSDKRVALARALDLRKALVEQRIASERIDIRALGRQTAEKPVDRVELTPYKPQKSANQTRG